MKISKSFFKISKNIKTAQNSPSELIDIAKGLAARAWPRGLARANLIEVGHVPRANLARFPARACRRLPSALHMHGARGAPRTPCVALTS